MKCLDCGHDMKTAKKNIRYTAGGLPQVVLGNISVSSCPECGYEEVALPHIEDLHKALATVMAQKQARLTGSEIRFLRTYLGWSSVDFAERMGTTRETVSRWESGKKQIGTQADRLLRLLVVYLAPVKDYSSDTLASIGNSAESREVRVNFRDSGHWAVPAMA